MLSILDQAFERLAADFLAAHPALSHEWRTVKRLGAPERLDLICAIGTSNEVFATLNGYQITVGITNSTHEDFEDFGRRMTDAVVAGEAFQRFVQILEECGHLQGRHDDGAAV